MKKKMYKFQFSKSNLKLGLIFPKSEIFMHFYKNDGFYYKYIGVVVVVIVW